MLQEILLPAEDQIHSEQQTLFLAWSVRASAANFEYVGPLV